MNDLQRRYTLDEILEIKKGRPKIQGLNYDALRMLRDPLYVKFAQELKTEAQTRQASISDDQEFKLLLQRLAQERNVPLDQLEELLRRLQGTTQDPYTVDDPKDGNDDDDDPMDDQGPGGGGPPPPPPPPPPGGGGPGASGGGGAEQSKGRGNLDSYITPETERHGDGSSGWRDRKDRSRRRRRKDYPDDDMDPPPGPPPATGPIPVAVQYKSNLELQAQIQELIDEARKKNRHDTMMREVRQRVPHEDPIKEIVREFHQVMYPTPIPVPQAQDNTQLIIALQQAMARNEDLSNVAQQMGLTMGQFVEFMRSQMQNAQPKPEISVTSSSSDMPPPPPPTSGKIAKATSEPLILKPREPTPISISTPRRSRSRTVEKARTTVDIPVPIPEPRQPSVVPIPVAPREPSTASTVQYDDQFRAQSKIREPSTASTVQYDDQSRAQSKIREAMRSRSRHADELVPDARRPFLPLQEEGTRGRSPTNRIEKIANQIAKTQNRALVKGQIRHHQLGKFALNMAAKQKEAAQTRAATAQPPKRPTKTFDDIINLTEPREQGQVVKRKELPFGASLQKQRVDSRGIARERFGGRLVA